MVRAIFGSVLLLSVWGIAAALLVPSLSPAPGGEAMIVRGAAAGGLQAVRFDAADCMPTLLLGDDILDTDSEVFKGPELDFRDRVDAVMAVDISRGLSEQSVVVILDSSGQVLAAGPAAFALVNFEQDAITACVAPDDDRADAI